MDLDRGLDAGLPGEALLDGVGESAELIRVQVGGRSSAQVDLHDLGPRGQLGGDPIELQLQRPEVSLDERLAPGHEHVAATVVAEASGRTGRGRRGRRAASRRSGVPAEPRPRRTATPSGLPADSWCSGAPGWLRTARAGRVRCFPGQPRATPGSGPASASERCKPGAWALHPAGLASPARGLQATERCAQGLRRQPDG